MLFSCSTRPGRLEQAKTWPGKIPAAVRQSEIIRHLTAELSAQDIRTAWDAAVKLRASGDLDGGLVAPLSAALIRMNWIGYETQMKCLDDFEETFKAILACDGSEDTRLLVEEARRKVEDCRQSRRRQEERRLKEEERAQELSDEGSWEDRAMDSSSWYPSYDEY